MRRPYHPVETIKRWGDTALALTAISAILAGGVSVFGGHLPPWATEAWAAEQEQRTQTNTQAINQLTVLLLSDKVAQIQGALLSNPGDQNLRASLLYWQNQLSSAQASTLPHK